MLHFCLTAIMLRLLGILLIVNTFYTSVESFFHQYPELTSGHYEGGDDPGEPLFLSPYVEKGDIKTGRKLASVPSDQWLGVESYAGFFTVDKDLKSNHFFWYFPSMTNAKEAPVILWLNRGPGGSSLIGEFIENGPISFFDGQIAKREVTWATNHHMIYIDQPVGTGFSFTNSSNGYCTNEVQIGAHLYSTMTQFFQLFPELQKNDFYVVGESYGGKYAPALAYTIHHRNPYEQLKINLKGIAIGDGWCDPINQISYDEYLYQLGLIDYNQNKALYKLRNETENIIGQKDWEKAFYKIGHLVGTGKRMSGINFYNFARVKKDQVNSLKENFGILFKQAAVRKSLHVGKLSFDGISENVFRNLVLDFPQSVAPWISELLNNYEVFIYNGELDIIVAYPLTEKYLRQLKYRDLDEYLTAERQVIRDVDDNLVGWLKQGGKLKEMLIRKAGHMVPHDQPKWAWDLITKFTHGTSCLNPNTNQLNKWHRDPIHFPEK